MEGGVFCFQFYFIKKLKKYFFSKFYRSTPLISFQMIFYDMVHIFIGVFKRSYGNGRSFCKGPPTKYHRLAIYRKALENGKWPAYKMLYVTILYR